MKFKGTILCPFWNMTMPLKEFRYAFFGTWLCPKTRFDPINTEHSALCKQDINKIINKTISSYRKPNFFWSIIPTFTEYHYVILSLGLPMSKMWIVETLTYIFKETKEKISVEIAMIDMLLSNRSTYISTSL